MGLLSFFGFGKNRILAAIDQGAMIIDVRTAAEFDQGKVPGSINIPLDRIPVNTKRILSMNKPVIFCCNSGSRSAQAVHLMKQAGLKEAYNGGNWMSLVKRVSRH